MDARIRYVTNADVCDIVRRCTGWIPHDVDGVVGLHPGGMLAGSVISGLLGKPLFQPGAFACGSGTYPDGFPSVRKGETHGRYLAVSLSPDDGGFERVSALAGSDGADVVPVVVCGSPGSADVVLSRESGVTLFEADFFRSHWVNECVFSIDGVLCEDPGLSVESDDAAYEAFVESAPPLVSLRHPVKALCTDRLIRHSGVTERWLARNGVSYGMLWMLDFAGFGDKLAKLDKPEYLGMKTKVYEKYPEALMFVEGRWGDALRIYKDTRRPVLCTGRNILLQDE